MWLLQINSKRLLLKVKTYWNMNAAKTFLPAWLCVLLLIKDGVPESGPHTVTPFISTGWTDCSFKPLSHVNCGHLMYNWWLPNFHNQSIIIRQSRWEKKQTFDWIYLWEVITLCLNNLLFWDTHIKDYIYDAFFFHHANWAAAGKVDRWGSWMQHIGQPM